MNIIFITQFYYPHMGGVEKHVRILSEKLVDKGNTVTVITTKFQPNLLSNESISGVKVIRFIQPKIKLIGLIYTWYWVVCNLNVFKKANIIHAHDVTIWLMPLKLLMPSKKIFSTMHGWEGSYPIAVKNIVLKKISRLISFKVIAIGKYIEKYYGILADKILYGAVNLQNKAYRKQRKLIFVGRLEQDTGVGDFIKLLKSYKNYTIEFYGDGSMRSLCSKYGKVNGFVDLSNVFKNAEFVFAGGYLVALEALSFGCKVLVAWDNPLKKDYWIDFPLYPYLLKPNESIKLLSNYSWENLIKSYNALWKLK